MNKPDVYFELFLNLTHPDSIKDFDFLMSPLSHPFVTGVYTMYKMCYN